MQESREPEKIALAAIKEAERKGCNVLIVDTAGRLQIDEELMEELVRLKGAIKPHEILLVVDALTGQDAVNAAEGFNDRLGIDGIIMTKMDGDSRGGAALSALVLLRRAARHRGADGGGAAAHLPAALARELRRLPREAGAALRRHPRELRHPRGPGADKPLHKPQPDRHDSPPGHTGHAAPLCARGGGRYGRFSDRCHRGPPRLVPAGK